MLDIFVRRSSPPGARTFLALALLLILTMPTALAGDLLEKDPTYPNVIPPVLVLGGLTDLSGPLSEPAGISITSTSIFVADCGNHLVQQFDMDGRLMQSLDRAGTIGFLCPTDVASIGNLTFVLDRALPAVFVLDDTGNSLFNWGTFGSAPGQLNDPHGIAVKGGRVLIADTGNNRVQGFDTEGNLEIIFGSHGASNGQFNEPTSVAMGRDEAIYVADTHNSRIQKFDFDGNFQASWGEYGSYLGEFAEPSDIATDSAGRVFVADLVNHRIQVFDENGTFLFTFGRHPLAPREGDGRLHYPISIAVGDDGSLVGACEPFESRCQFFSGSQIEHEYVHVNDSAWWNKYPFFHYGRRLKVAYEADMLVPVPGDVLAMSEPDVNMIVVFDASGPVPIVRASFGGHGTELGKLRGPHGVGMSAYGEIFVTDSFNHRVQVFTLDGEFLRTWGHFGTGPGEFNTPSSGSVVTSAGGHDLTDEGPTVFIGDTRNHRIQMFDTLGTYKGELGGFGPEIGQLNTPTDFILNNAGTILYVLDSFNHRVQAFNTSTGAALFTFGQLGHGPGEFLMTSGIAVDTDDNVYVTDQGIHRVSRFSPNGTFLDSWGHYGSDPGLFLYPQGIAVDSRNRVYIVDFGNHRGQVFDTKGNFIAIFGEEILSPIQEANQGRRDEWLPAWRIPAVAAVLLLLASLTSGRRGGNLKE